jgi:Cys-tRNA(Pro)/Cys-tRNA(Cys) deacylase
VSPPKTNAARALDALGIPYRLVPYEVDEEHLDAETVAAAVGLPPEQVYKTLLVRCEPIGPVFALIAANQELDLKAVARVAGGKEASLVALKEVQPLTGYIRGGVTALAAKKAFPVIVDELFELWDVVSVSAGQRGLQLFLAPGDYVRAVEAKSGAIGRLCRRGEMSCTSTSTNTSTRRKGCKWRRSSTLVAR